MNIELMNKELNEILDMFIMLFNNDAKQHDKDWLKLMGKTVGGSEIAALLGLNPFSDFYKVVSSKINICKGIKPEPPSISCIWGTIFETVATKIIEIDLGNQVKGSNICIQRVEGHRNSPDGYTIINLYKKDNIYHIWTTDMDKSIIELSIIVLLEIKCPISRKITGDIPKYYKPQVLSGLAVSPIATNGLYVDFLFKKCSLQQLEYNSVYDINFHKKDNNNLLPIAYGVIPFMLNRYNISNESRKIYETIFDKPYDENSDNTVIDLGNVSNDTFTNILNLTIDYNLLFLPSTVKFYDNRTSDELLNFSTRSNYILYAVLPWKLFDISYVSVKREPNFLESVYPIIQKVHSYVECSLRNDLSIKDTEVINICSDIYD